ncbi:MAG: phenylalanine--tRNA ligase subunit beta [Candidatus Nomurabacteria bacterium]|jgi:phenylalanyl-tRNA synthetase beta chain|nr:phenylalanine--tRNA ligase subunit beta [Candidatus Nomurabacteria bacterium]
MIISLNWLKKYVDLDGFTDAELAEKIGSRLVEVEEFYQTADKYQGVYVVRVIESRPIGGSDHLSLCWIDDAGAVADVKRDERGWVQVVCGAPNVRQGMLAVWIAPKAVVPATYGTKTPFIIDAKKLKGFESSGMLAGADELDFGAEHTEILEIDENLAVAGAPFAEAFGLDDTLFDIENKSLTHRPDCFGVIGFAREVAGILGKEFQTPEFMLDEGRVFPPEASDLRLELVVEDEKLCPRYQATILEIGGKAPSPATHIKEFGVPIVASGMRLIDSIVDISNYLMLLTGQPLHCFDYDKMLKVGGRAEGYPVKIVVREAKKGEKIKLLDGSDLELDTSDIVICSNEKPVALAGVMGGENTAIDKDTKRIVVESATFNLYRLRDTSMRHGIFSEAVTRFMKGQPASLTDKVLKETVKLFTEKYNFKLISPFFDSAPERVEHNPIELTVADVNELLGTDYSVDLIKNTLTNVNFAVANMGDRIIVRTPYWRTDIHIKEDVIEEVGRLNGFDDITPTLPMRFFESPKSDKMYNLKSAIRRELAAFGANEILSYSFVSEKLLEKANLDFANSYKIINSISPDLQYVRQSLTPSLLEKVFLNIDDGFDNFALFEINKVYQKSYNLGLDNLPNERDHLALTLFQSIAKNPYYLAKLYVEKLLQSFGVEAKFVVSDPAEVLMNEHATARPFEKKRAALVVDAKTGKKLGGCGEYKKSVSKAFKLPDGLAGFELNLNTIAEVIPDKIIKYRPLPRYPSAKRDMTFKIDSALPYAQLESLVHQTLEDGDVWFQLEPVSIYQGENETKKNISFRLNFASFNKTLTSAEIADIIKTIADKTAEKLGAEVV